MLNRPHACSSADIASLEARVRELIAETTGITAGESPLGPAVDSLTLIAILTRLETALGVAFETEVTVALLGSRDLTDLARTVARAIAAQHANLDETAGNASCMRDESAS